MLTLYHCFSARSFRPLWALEELGLTYDLKMLPFPPRARAREYLQVNPLGTIPTLLDGEVRMTESAAICQYLADRYGRGNLGVAPDDPAYGAYLNGLHFGEATLTFPQTLVLRYRRLEPEARRQPQTADDYARWFHARVRAYAPTLAQGFVGGGRFTAADISVGYAFMLAERVGIADDLVPEAKAYWAGLQTRPGFKAATAAQEAAAKAQDISTGW